MVALCVVGFTGYEVEPHSERTSCNLPVLIGKLHHKLCHHTEPAMLILRVVCLPTAGTVTQSLYGSKHYYTNECIMYFVRFCVAGLRLYLLLSVTAGMGIRENVDDFNDTLLILSLSYHVISLNVIKQHFI